jgi:secreted trypsin-like serine protease
MLKLLAVLLLAGASMAAPSVKADTCGDPKIKPDTTRIVGGKEAKRNSWPWMAALFKKPMFGTWYQFCGGSLIAPQWVMTAGHCFYRETNVKNFKILLGAHNKAQVEGTQFEAFVEEIHVNPDYDPSEITNDITLLKLTAPVTFTDEISPVCVAEKTDPADDTMGYITGWGTTRAGGSTSNVLMQTNVPIVSQAKCKDEYSHIGATVDDTMICAGYEEGGKDTCQGDSGGPFVFQSDKGIWTQHGITSWGKGCAEPHYAGVYARVTALRKFIDDTMNA